MSKSHYSSEQQRSSITDANPNTIVRVYQNHTPDLSASATQEQIEAYIAFQKQQEADQNQLSTSSGKISRSSKKGSSFSAYSNLGRLGMLFALLGTAKALNGALSDTNPATTSTNLTPLPKDSSSESVAAAQPVTAKAETSSQPETHAPKSAEAAHAEAVDWMTNYMLSSRILQEEITTSIGDIMLRFVGDGVKGLYYLGNMPSDGREQLNRLAKHLEASKHLYHQMDYLSYLEKITKEAKTYLVKHKMVDEKAEFSYRESADNELHQLLTVNAEAASLKELKDRYFSKMVTLQMKENKQFSTNIGKIVIQLKDSYQSDVSAPPKSQMNAATSALYDKIYKSLSDYQTSYNGRKSQERSHADYVQGALEAVRNKLSRENVKNVRFSHEELIENLARTYFKQKQEHEWPHLVALHEWLNKFENRNAVGLGIAAIVTISATVYHFITNRNLPAPAVSPAKRPKTPAEIQAEELEAALSKAESAAKDGEDLSVDVPPSLQKVIPLTKFTLPHKYWRAKKESISNRLKHLDNGENVLWELWEASNEHQEQIALVLRKQVLLTELTKISDISRYFDIQSFAKLLEDTELLLARSQKYASLLAIGDKATKSDSRLKKDANTKNTTYSEELIRLKRDFYKLTGTIETQCKTLLDEWTATEASIQEALEAYDMQKAEAAIRKIEVAIGITSAEKNQQAASGSSLNNQKAKLIDIKASLENIQKIMKALTEKLDDALNSPKKSMQLEQKQKLEAERKAAEEEIVKQKQQQEEATKYVAELEKRLRDLQTLGEIKTKEQYELEAKRKQQAQTPKEPRPTHGALSADPEKIRENKHVKRAYDAVKKFWDFPKLSCTTDAERLVVKNAALKHMGQLFNAMWASSKDIGITQIINFVDVNFYRQSVFHLEPLLLKASTEEIVGMTKFIKDTFGHAISDLAQKGEIKDKPNPDYSKCDLFDKLRKKFTPSALPEYSDKQCLKGIVQCLKDLSVLHKERETIFKDDAKREELFNDASEMIVARMGEYVKRLKNIAEALPEKERPGSIYALLAPAFKNIAATVRPAVHHPDPKANRPHKDEENKAKVSELLKHADAFLEHFKLRFPSAFAVSGKKEEGKASKAEERSM